MAEYLDGKKLASKLKDQLRAEIAELKDLTGKVPLVRNILIGNEAGSCAYANSQKRTAEQIGINYELVTLPDETTQEVLIKYVNELNEDESVNGIMIHKPVPSHIDYQTVANYIDIQKDLEGINAGNIGKMLLNETTIIPCTPAAVVEHIKSTPCELRGKEVVIVGASEIVGKPLSLLLLQELATVTVCHIATSEAGQLVEHVSKADILIVAVGIAGLIKGDWIKEGAIVVDVGINKVGDKIVGDVEFKEAERRASYITPVPGGVGPVTVVMLMKNGIEAFKMQTSASKIKN